MPQANVPFIQRPNYIGDALQGLIGAQQQHEQENAQQDALQQQQNTTTQQARVKFLLDQYLKQPADVQTKLYATAPADIKQFLIDPNLAYNSPDAQMQRQIQQTVQHNTLGVAQNFKPTGGDTSAINYALMTQKNAPSEYLTQGYVRDYLDPQQIGMTMVAPAVKDYASAAASNATAAKTNAEVPWVAPEAKARINLQGAQAGKASADTAKTQTENKTLQNNLAMSTTLTGGAPRLQKTQQNAAGQTRTVYSDDGGATWHP